MATGLNYKNVEEFVGLVRQRHALYDSSHPLHSNRDAIASIWKEIAQEVTETEGWCRIKWSNLRSNFCREMRRRDSGDIRGEQLCMGKSWIWFDAMEFLLPFIDKKRSSAWRANSLKRERFYKKNPDPAIFAPFPKVEVCMEEVDDHEWDAFQKDDRQSCKDDELVEVSNASPTMSDSEFADDDKSFLMSILPLMKKISLQDNIQFRIEVHQLIFDKIFPNKGANSSGDSSTVDVKIENSP